MLATAALALWLQLSPDPAGSAASAALQPPNPERWAPAFEGDGLLAAECSEHSIDGVVWCRYEHRGLLRGAKYAAKKLLVQIRSPGRRVKGRTRFWIRGDPLFCPWERARGYAGQLLARAGLQVPIDQGLRLEERPDSVIGRSATRWLAYAATPYELIELDLYVPGGIADADVEDFEALLASLQPVDGSDAAYRRGIWLTRNFASDPMRLAAATCGMGGAERLALAQRELARAAQSRPHDWRPWAELGALLEQEAGGEDWLARLVGRERAKLPRGGVWVGLPAPDPARPADRDKLLEAASLYGEAARRSPPARHPLGSSEELALDSSSVLAARARCLAKVGDAEAAAAAYGRALEEGQEGSWGLLEASLWLAERALRRGDRAEAQRLYGRADRAWREFYAGSGAASGWGPLLRAKIDARLSELD
jgi:tetratricopeptide (TPR) repeat protein